MRLPGRCILVLCYDGLLAHQLGLLAMARLDRPCNGPLPPCWDSLLSLTCFTYRCAWPGSSRYRGMYMRACCRGGACARGHISRTRPALSGICRGLYRAQLLTSAPGPGPGARGRPPRPVGA